MLKLRITFSKKAEADKLIQEFGQSYNILNISKVYKGRGNSQYSNIYIDVEEKQSKG